MVWNACQSGIFARMKTGSTALCLVALMSPKPLLAAMDSCQSNLTPQSEAEGVLRRHQKMSPAEGLDALERLEKGIARQVDQLSARFGSNHEQNSLLQIQIENLLTQQNQVQLLQDRALADEEIEMGLVWILETKVYSILYPFRPKPSEIVDESPQPKAEKDAIDLLIEHPETVKADHIYETQIVNDSRPLRFLFSSQIVKDVFQSKNPIMNIYRAKMLKALRRGFSGGSQEAGIKAYVDNRDVFEVRTLGQHGNFRLGGYMEDHVLHLVHWSDASDHGTTGYKLRFMKAVRSAHLKHSK